MATTSSTSPIYSPDARRDKFFAETAPAAVETGNVIFEALFGTKPAEGAVSNVLDQHLEAHHVLRVTIPANVELPGTFKTAAGQRPDTCIFRVFKPDEAADPLSPYQLRQEVGIRKYIQAKAGDKVPQPRIYAWNDGADGKPLYVAEELLGGEPINDCWYDWDNKQKDVATRSLVKALVALADIEFPRICGVDPDDASLTPPVELSRKYARSPLFIDKAYDIGPYRNQADYILAQFDKEMAFWTSDLPVQYGAWGEEEVKQYGSQAGYAKQIRAARAKVKWHVAEVESYGPETPERFAVQHGSMQDNILHDRATGRVVAITGWEWAVVMPVHCFLAPWNHSMGGRFLWLGSRPGEAQWWAKANLNRAAFDADELKARSARIGADNDNATQWERLTRLRMRMALWDRGWRKLHRDRCVSHAHSRWLPMAHVRYGNYFRFNVERPSEERHGRILHDHIAEPDLKYTAYREWDESGSETTESDDSEDDDDEEGSAAGSEYSFDSDYDSDGISSPDTPGTAHKHKRSRLVSPKKY